MPDTTWIVRPSKFPFGISTTELGRVTAPDHDTALDLARAQHGAAIVVERLTRRAPAGALNPAEDSPIPAAPETARGARQRRGARRSAVQTSLGLRRGPKPPRGPQGGRAA